MRKIKILLLLLWSVSSQAAVFVVGEGLYWQAHGNGLEFAIEKGENSSHLKHLEFDRDYGFRIGVGDSLPFDAWDVYLSWTRFHTTARGHGKGDLLPLWTKEASAANDAKAHWRLHLGLIDADLGREFCISKWVYLKPTLGVRCSVARQKYYITYRGDAFTRDLVSMKNKFFGIGPKIGLNSRFCVGGDISLFAQGSLSLSSGKFYVHESDHLEGSPKFKVFNRFHLIRAFSDIRAGLEWASSRTQVQVAWEHHLLFGQNQLIRFMDGTLEGPSVSNLGDLTLQGLTVAATFDF